MAELQSQENENRHHPHILAQPNPFGMLLKMDKQYFTKP
jgi:hypothetical protein